MKQRKFHNEKIHENLLSGRGSCQLPAVPLSDGRNLRISDGQVNCPIKKTEEHCPRLRLE